MVSEDVNCSDLHSPQAGQSSSAREAVVQPVLERPPNPHRGSSGVRFSQGTKVPSQSPMSSHRRSNSDPDEATPIRSSDGNSARQYNTSDESNDRSRTTATTATSNTPTSDTLVTDSRNDIQQKDEDEEKKDTWFRKVADAVGSVTLENKGSVARDHLALERTFLAWLRTSLAFASIGIAVTQLFRLNTSIQSKQSTSCASAQAIVPLAPLLGHSVPAEMIPFLQEFVAHMAFPKETPELGPTLLDQLLLLPPGGLAPIEPGTLMPRASLDATDAATKLRHMGKPLGATFIAISIVILLIGGHRYFEAQHWIIRGKFPASRGSIFTVTFITASLIITSLAVVLAVAPTKKS